MLVLSRKPDESITLETSDGIVEIVINKITNQRVSLGVIAPKSVSVLRTELYNKKSK